MGKKQGHEPQLGGTRRAQQTGGEPLLGGDNVLQAALDALNSGQNGPIWRGARLLVGIGVDALPVLNEALTHPDYRVRSVAAWGFSKLAEYEGTLSSVPGLIRRLEDHSEEVRIVAAAALRQIAVHHGSHGQAARDALTTRRYP